MYIYNSFLYIYIYIYIDIYYEEYIIIYKYICLKHMFLINFNNLSNIYTIT